MSLGTRDAEAYAVVQRRSFGGTSLVSLEIEMQTRRLTARVYGKLEGGADTHVASLIFFGVSELTLSGEGTDDDADAGFPQSAAIESISLSYDDDADVGSASIEGSKNWALDFSFDGLAYEQTPAVLSSLADD